MLKPRVSLLPSRVKPLNSRMMGDRAERKAIYDSARWQELRSAKLRADPSCQRCAFLGLVTAALHVDHWVALAVGGDAYEWDNLVSLCHSDHSEKTQLELKGQPLFEIAPSNPRPRPVFA